MGDASPLAIYVHWPFCLSKCPYCDFNSHVIDGADQEIWRQAYRRELEHYADIVGKRIIKSVFFGGGTPSLMEPKTVASVLQDISRLWPVDTDVEITLEANPSSSDAEKFSGFKNAGINRLSLGVQSFRDDVLRFLGRAHNAEEAEAAINAAAKIFHRYSFDMIYAYKGQTPDSWMVDLVKAVGMANGHLSLYQLTIEPHTVFHTRTRKGENLSADEKIADELYDITQEVLSKANLPAYEVSNHAASGQESKHNLAYWKYEEYLGIGPGAHGRYLDSDRKRFATENHKSPEAWLRQTLLKEYSAKNTEYLDEEVSMREALIVGMRLTDGINMKEWQRKFSKPFWDFVNKDKAIALQKHGIIRFDEISISTTKQGIKLLDSVLQTLLP